MAFYMVFYMVYILVIYLIYILVIFLAYILVFYLAAEIQRCPLSSEGPRRAEVGEEIGEELARRKWTWK